MSMPLWTVTKIEDVVVFTPGTGAVPSKKVTFEVLGDTTSTLVIPDTEFTPKEVNKRIDAMATAMLQVLNLRGADIPMGADNQPISTPGGY